jgi:hypothetical protein
MDEPTYERESEFWDQVADWLLARDPADCGPLSRSEFESFLRDTQHAKK